MYGRNGAGETMFDMSRIQDVKIRGRYGNCLAANASAVTREGGTIAS